MLPGFPIARSLALTLFGFLQNLLLTADKVTILTTNIVYVHVERVMEQMS